MAQNITVDDVAREVRAVYALGDAEGSILFCFAGRGDATCDRHYLHHGKHAHLTGAAFDRSRGFWFFTRLVTWK